MEDREREGDAGGVCLSREDGEDALEIGGAAAGIGEMVWSEGIIDVSDKLLLTSESSDFEEYEDVMEFFSEEREEEVDEDKLEEEEEAEEDMDEDEDEE